MALITSENMAKSTYSKIEYKDKNRERDIKKDVRNEFNRIDSWIYRDDQEIRKAWMNTIDSYILQLKYSKWLRVDNEKFWVKNWKAILIKSENIYKNEALTYFKKARNDLVKKYNAVTWIKITSSNYNKQLINDIAYDIDKAENNALMKIKLKCNPMQEQTNAIEKSSVVRDKKWNVKVAKNWKEVVKQKPMFTQDKNWILTFTDRSNKPTIHEAFRWLFPKGKNYKYKINYKGCTNQSIKNKMTQLTWTWQCWISYDETAKTYLLRDKNWKTIQTRALIWEWVTLQRDELIQWNTYEEEEKRKANIWKIDATSKSEVAPENDDKLKEMVKDIPESLKKELKKRWNEEYRKFIIETEKRLGVILRYGKEHGYELHKNPVSKLRTSAWLMEINFINWDTEPDVKVRENSSDPKKENAWKLILWEGLYNLLDANEDDYLTYLTARVRKLRWWKFDELTVKDDLLEVKPNYNLQNSERLPEQTVGTINYWIWILREFIENHRETEWNSWLDNDDRYLTSMKQELDNLEYTIQSRRETTKKEDMETVINKTIDKLANLWWDYWGMDPTLEKEKIRKALLWSTNQEQNEAVRKMAEWKRIFWDVTESSFLADKISTNWTVEDMWVMLVDANWNPILDQDGNPIMRKWFSWWLEVNDTTINKYFSEINKLLFAELQYSQQDSLILPKDTKDTIDGLYSAANDKTWSKIINLLIEKWMLPDSWRENNDVKEKAKDIATTLREKASVFNNLSISDIKSNEQKEKRQLEMKSNKTEEDLQRLQALEYLQEHPNEAEEIHKKSLNKMKDELKYWWINDIIRSSLASIFVDKWWWAKGKNADIYNDIVWYGFWDLSDENAKLAWEILAEIIITVIVAVATAWTWAVIVAWALRGASIAARSARWLKLANNISKVIQLSQKWYKWLSIWAKTVKLWYRWTALLIEGTTFNTASNIIHSAMNGTSLDNLNLNPIAKENVQTAAFLWALSISGKLTQAAIKAWWKTKLAINLMEWLQKAHLQNPTKFTAWLVSEMWSMLAAEQAINFTFWHDVIDPETWKVVTSHAPTLPTQQELTQMVWMILAFKAVKPWLRAKYEKKLNDWTLEICRSVKKNEILIRDPKTWKTEKIQELIDWKYNNYKPTPEQYKLRNHNKRLEKQSKYNAEYSEAIETISKIPEELRSESMRKLLKYKDMIEASPNDIKRIQREIWLKWKEVDWVIGPNTLTKLKEYIKTLESKSSWWEKKTWELSEEEIQNLINKKELHEKRKAELEKDKAELEAKRHELLKQREANWRSLDLQENGIEKITNILQKWNIITIDWLKYKFIGIKNGKAEFVIDSAARKSAEQGWKRFSEKVEISSLEELLNHRFNLEPWQKRTNSGRYKKLEQLINDKIEPLDRLQKKIRDKQKEITTLQEEIARLEKWKNTTAFNDYFEQHKNEIVWKNVRIDGVKYSAEHLNTDGTIQFKEVDWNRNFTISSFKQLAEKGEYINGFSNYLDANWKPMKQWTTMSKSEINNHELIKNLISRESDYLSSRNIDQTLREKRSKLQKAQEELKWLQEKLPSSQSRQEKIDERARKWEEINKELMQVESEIERINSEISEADRLIKKYQKELDWKAVTKKEERGDTKEENDGSENIESKINEEFSRIESWNYENIKLDRITQKMFETWALIEWVNIRFKNISLKPNIKLPKEFLRNLRNKLVEMKEKRWDKLSEYHRKLIDKINKLIERKSKENPQENEVNIDTKDIEEIQQERKEQERKEQERKNNEEELQDADVEIVYTEIQEYELNMLRELNKWRNEQTYLNEFGEPKNVIPLWNGENLYVSNCLQLGSRKYIVWYIQKWREMKLRLFYRSKSEGVRRSCPWERPGWGFSKWEDIPNSSYETTTRVHQHLQYKFDSLPTEATHSNPILLEWVWYNILEPEMITEIKVDKLINSPKNDTVDYFRGHNSTEIKNMYKKLWSKVNISWMNIIEWKWYTYEHQYLWTIEVKVCRLNYHWKDLDFSFAKVKDDPKNRVWIEEVSYADAKISSFWIYDKQINAAPLTWKPIDYTQQVPYDMQWNEKIWGSYIDIRDLYQENPFIKKFKEISQ